MSKKTIFGENAFFDTSMVVLEYNNAVEKYVYDEFSSAVKMMFPNVRINKEKLERWVKLCLHLENIEYSELKDVAVKKKINNLKNQLALTEKALELACKELRDASCMQCNSCNRFEMCGYVLSTYPSSYFIEEAKEMMKSE